jgi:carbamoyl-phosphate synthase large subunit
MRRTEPLTVLILGLGGNVSQGILKALHMSSLSTRTVGACISPLSAGLFATDKAYLSPLAADPAFVDWLVDTCRSERVDAVLSGSEAVLDALAPRRDELEQATGAVILVSSPEAVSIGGDKLQTCAWLEGAGLNFPRYADAADPTAMKRLAAEAGYPLIAKPRHGKASAGIMTLWGADDLGCIPTATAYVVEEMLTGDEFTAGCFSDGTGEVQGSIVMRRSLAAGTTVEAEIGDFPEPRDQALRIAEQLRPLGPCNVQLREHQGRAVCFEINVRFSGTTPIRAHYGFNEVDAALRQFVVGEKATLPPVTSGRALRYWNEVYIDGDSPEIGRDGIDRPARLADFDRSLNP